MLVAAALAAETDVTPLVAAFLTKLRPHFLHGGFFMFRPIAAALFLGLLLVGFALADEPARIEITCPAEAELWIDGEQSQQTGTLRTFTTPALEEPGRYMLRVRIDGVDTEEAVTVYPGKVTRVTINPPLPGKGAWPEGVEFPEGLARYQRARYAQRIATTNGSPSIGAIARSSMIEKWRVSGGMEGISGWKSDVYKLVPKEPNTRQERIPVFNGSNDQYEWGWVRTYHPGTRFFDCLSNTKTGKVFELRERHLDEDRAWRSEVVFRDVGERPAGYHGLKVTCSSCHNHASGPGTGGYAAALVPGSDTIFSDKLPIE